MLGRLGPLELGIIVLIVLLLFGAARLPQLGAAVGKTMREFRKGMHGALDEVEAPAAVEKPSAAPKPPTEHA